MMDREAWCAAVHEVTKSQAWLKTELKSWLTMLWCFRWTAKGLNHTYICIHSPQTPLLSRLPYDMEQSSLSCAVGPFWLSVLFLTFYLCWGVARVQCCGSFRWTARDLSCPSNPWAQICFPFFVFFNFFFHNHCLPPNSDPLRSRRWDHILSFTSQALHPALTVLAEEAGLVSGAPDIALASPLPCAPPQTLCSPRCLLLAFVFYWAAGTVLRAL